MDGLSGQNRWGGGGDESEIDCIRRIYLYTMVLFSIAAIIFVGSDKLVVKCERNSSNINATRQNMNVTCLLWRIVE